MGCSGSSTASAGPKQPWEIETDQIRSLCGATRDPHQVALICQRNGKRFIDLTFPPCAASAGKGLEQVAWGRPQDILKGKPAYLYDQDIVPNDVQQGELGDCWFICVLAILAENPSMVRKICPVQYSDIEQGIFRLRLCKDGWWEWVVVDSFFPCTSLDRTSLKFGHCRSDQEFWVPVLEKAYARLYGSYEALAGGDPSKALADLTGCSSFDLDLGKVSIDELFSQLMLAFGCRFLVTTATKGKDTSDYNKGGATQGELSYAAECKKMGIVAGHAYSVLRVENYRGAKLIKLRNPWGSCEWKGAWGDGSPEMTADAKRQLNQNDSNDGSFWMPLQDFTRFFEWVSVTRFRQDGTVNDWTDYRMRGTIERQRPNFFAKVIVKHDTLMEVSVHNQTYRRECPEKQFQTSLSHLVYGTNDGKTYTPVTADEKTKNYQLKANSHPYLVVPHQSGLTVKHNGQQFTLVVTCSESTTKVRTYDLLPSMHSDANSHTDLKSQTVESLGSVAIRTQKNGLPPPTSNWNSELVRCPESSECKACIGSCFFPCCMSACLRSDYDDSNCLLNLLCLTGPLMRNIIREGYSIEGTCVQDICAGTCCYCCSLLQVRRELLSKNRTAQVAHMKRAPTQPMYTNCYSVDHCGCPCFCSCVCPCISNAKTRSKFDGSNCCFNFCCLFGPMARNIIREGYHLDGNCVGDICCSICFAPCSANQLRQEVEIRGPKSQQDVVQHFDPEPIPTSGAPQVAATSAMS